MFKIEHTTTYYCLTVVFEGELTLNLFLETLNNAIKITEEKMINYNFKRATITDSDSDRQLVVITRS